MENPIFLWLSEVFGMLVGTVTETYPGERRVGLTPGAVKSLQAKGISTVIEAGAGLEAGFPDEEYKEEGARIADRETVYGEADVVCHLRAFSANPSEGRPDLQLMRQDQSIVGFCEPLTDAAPLAEMAATGVRSFAVELIPRITRAQSMDALSSQAMVAGYKAGLIAATTLPKMFPMSMTAAGTVAAARVLVVGVGVAGLQAIATCKRLGAVVSAYDIRAAAKGEAESVGARFLELALPTTDAEGGGGYAKAMDDKFYQAQRKLMGEAVAKSDIVITTAAVPGKRSPVLVDAKMVDAMRPGSVIIDLAAERGGNCEVTEQDKTIQRGGVKILGPTNLPATVPLDASQMYANNLVAFLNLLIKDGALNVNMEDEIIEQTLLTQGGDIVQSRVREILGLEEVAERKGV